MRTLAEKQDEEVESPTKIEVTIFIGKKTYALGFILGKNPRIRDFHRAWNYLGKCAKERLFHSSLPGKSQC